VNLFSAARLYDDARTCDRRCGYGQLLDLNEHPIERVVRVALGIALVALAAMGTIGAWGYIGVVPILTGLVGTCPLYSLLGMSTCPVKAS
jgi:hypothetical protein